MLKKNRKIACYTREGQLVKNYNCAAEAVEDGYTEANVLTACDCAWGMAYGGYVWKYV